MEYRLRTFRGVDSADVVLIHSEDQPTAQTPSLQKALEAFHAEHPSGYLLNAILKNQYLTGANLSGISFSRSVVQGMRFSDCDLHSCDFSGCSMNGTQFFGCNLQDASFSGADLGGVHFTGCNLQGANFTETNLTNTHLRDCDVRRIYFPAPTMVLLMNWGVLSNTLTKLAMAYDASTHREPQRFDTWARAVVHPCPYLGEHYERSCLFHEQPGLWESKLKRKRIHPYELMKLLVLETQVNSDWHMKPGHYTPEQYAAELERLKEPPARRKTPRAKNAPNKKRAKNAKPPKNARTARNGVRR